MQATNWLKIGPKKEDLVKRQGTLVSKIGRQKRAKGAMPSYLLHTSF